MPINRFSKTKKSSNTFRQRLKHTNSKRRTNKKRGTNKKRTNKKRTNKKRGTNKKRTNKHRVAKKLYQRGGKFSLAEEAQLRDKLKEKGVTDNEKIDSYIEKLGLSSQIFSGSSFEQQLIYQLDAVPLENLDEWINGMGDFEEDVKTDNENTENTDDSENTYDSEDTN